MALCSTASALIARAACRASKESAASDMPGAGSSLAGSCSRRGAAGGGGGGGGDGRGGGGGGATTSSAAAFSASVGSGCGS